ncbi:MAG: thioredoxin domain-containing protein, partial [Sedimenticolaceae bacterium]
CGPCHMMAPAFEQAAAQLEPTVRLLKVNTEEQQAIGAQFGIRSIPTMVLFAGGREVARMSGAMNAASIVGWTQQQLH